MCSVSGPLAMSPPPRLPPKCQFEVPGTYLVVGSWCLLYISSQAAAILHSSSSSSSESCSEHFFLVLILFWDLGDVDMVRRSPTGNGPSTLTLTYIFTSALSVVFRTLPPAIVSSGSDHASQIIVSNTLTFSSIHIQLQYSCWLQVGIKRINRGSSK